MEAELRADAEWKNAMALTEASSVARVGEG